jgi:two-component system chemotaxis response regulator CheY
MYRLILKKLTAENLTFLFAQDGNKGLQMIKESRPELVISEINLPGLDFFKLIEEVKKLKRKTKFIIVTSEYTDEIYYKARRFGVKFYFIKPFKSVKLLEAIKMVLKL